MYSAISHYKEDDVILASRSSMLHQMHNGSSNAKYSLLKVPLQNNTKLKYLFYYFFILVMEEFSCNKCVLSKEFSLRLS